MSYPGRELERRWYLPNSRRSGYFTNLEDALKAREELVAKVNAEE